MGGNIWSVAATCLALSGCSKAGSWTFSAGNDPMTDAPFAEATTESKNETGRLAIACSGAGDRPRLLIEARSRMGGFRDELNFVDRVLRYRFDDGPIQDTLGTIGDHFVGFEYTGRGEPRDAAIIAGMMTAKTLAIETVDAGGDAHQFVFDVQGAKSALRKVAKHCGAANQITDRS